MKKIVLYSHGGSGNRGCEAIIRGTKKIIDKYTTNDFYLCTLNKEEDIQVGLDEFKEIIEYSNYVKRNSLDHIKSVIINKIFKTTDQYVKLAQKNLYKTFDSDTLAISVGGDNYCYTDSKWLYLSNKEAKRKNCRTVLWGCSVEESNIDHEMKKDLDSYDLIVARESITYNSLIKNGINKNIKLYPDPAFQLELEEVELPYGFELENTIGINLSPYIYKSKLSKEKVINLYTEFIQYIIESTGMKVALIPHVFWKHNNDIDVLSEIYSKLNRKDRVVFINKEYNCKQLKSIISKCRIFIGARTHSTIAAYSTCVPTLVLGYSVKSRGIARDIFGSEKNMVISVQEFETIEELKDAFEYIKIKEEDLREHLNNIMPEYKIKSMEAGMEIIKLI